MPAMHCLQTPAPAPPTPSGGGIAGTRTIAPRGRTAPVLRLLALTAAIALLGVGSAIAQQRVVHSWQRLFYAELDGRESLLFVERFERSKPAPGDLDGDGDLDLMLGRADGRLFYFENQGSDRAPRWRLVNAAVPARRAGREDGALRPVDVGENAAPALVDIDGDGDLDLFVGAASGRLYFFRNVGNRYLPSFEQASDDFLGARLGLNLVPKFPDLNGDGLPDFGFGNEAGRYGYVLNAGSRATPRYCLRRTSTPECLAPLVQLGQLDPEDNAAPEWTDWDGDGDLDLMVGKSDGTVAHFQNIGDRREGTWEQVVARFNIVDAGGYAAPVFADMNGDRHPDVLLAGDSEQIAYYTYRPRERPFPLWLEDKNVLQVRSLGRFQTRVQVTAGDIDADGDADLIIGTRGGDLLLYENVGSPTRLALRSPRGPLLPTPQRAFAAPTLADVDGDGDLDLIVGGREGRLEWIENAGTPQAPRWKARSLFYAKVAVGSLAVPRFADVDGDGDADLLVGNSRGNVVRYENTGTARKPDFALRETRFGGVTVPSNAVPALFPWNPQGAADLVVGSQAGTLVPATRNPAVPVAQRGAYERRQSWAGGLLAPSYSAPFFGDLTGDGRPDLLLGTGPGAVLLWRYEGSAAPPPVAAAPPPANVVEDRTTQPTSAAGLTAETTTTAPGPADTPPLATGETLPLEPIFVYERSPLEELALGRNTKPTLHDVTGDGRLDLVVGTGGGKLLLVAQAGDPAAPSWRIATQQLAGYANGRNPAPAFADVDGDGDADLVVGNERGQVRFWEYAGGPWQRAFVLREDVFATVRAGKNAVPALHDVNGDGRVDLLVGNLKGEVLYYEQQPGLRFTLAVRRFIGVDVGVNASPVVARLTDQPQPFLVLGSDQGLLHIYGATGTSPVRSSGWRGTASYVEGLRFPPGSHPAVGDVDGDGDPDLVVGSDRGKLLLFRNHARQPGLAAR